MVKPHLNAVLVHSRVRDAIVVLCVDPEVVLLVDGEVPHAAVRVRAVVAHLHPGAGTLLRPGSMPM